MTISDTLNSLQTDLNDFAIQHGGGAFIASDLSHMWEQAYAASDKLRIIICYMGEDLRGPFGTAAATQRVDRHFTVLITRGRGFNAIRGAPLTTQTGNVEPLFALVEEARDGIRTMRNLTDDADLPVDYRGVKTFSMGEVAMDCYQIEFSVAADLFDVMKLHDTEPASMIPA